MSPLVALTVLFLAQGPDSKPDDRPAPASAPAAADLVAALETTLADAIARAETSVVAIHRHKGPNPEETKAVRGRRRAGNNNEERDRFDLQIPAVPDDFVSLDYGSGVVIGNTGEILTAFHVVRGADRLRVHAPGNQSFEAEVIAADPRSDLAVIVPVEMAGVERPKLRPIAIGDSTKLRKGSFLIVLGNHYNAARDDGSASASWGILSNFARRLDPEARPYGARPIAPLRSYPTLLQLDAKLNLGMSGGAVVNLKGELVGLTTTAASPAGFDAQAGYAIPMDRLGRRVIETLKLGKEMEYGLLGITAEDKTTRITRVTPNTPAGRGGLLQLGDEILAINGTPVSSFDELVLTVGIFPPGEPIKLKIRRSDEIIERTLVLTKAPLDGEVIATAKPRAWRGLRLDFSTALGIGEIGPFAAELTGGGVVVTDVEEGSPAAAAGLKKGVVIMRVGDRPVLSPKGFHQAVDGQDGDVTLDTDIGVRTVGLEGSARPKPAEPGRRGR